MLWPPPGVQWRRICLASCASTGAVAGFKSGSHKFPRKNERVAGSEGEQLAIATRQGRIQVMLRGYGGPLPLFTPPRPRKPDTNTVTIYRQQVVEQKKSRADSAKRDSLGASVISGKSPLT